MLWLVCASQQTNLISVINKKAEDLKHDLVFGEDSTLELVHEFINLNI